MGVLSLTFLWVKKEHNRTIKCKQAFKQEFLGITMQLFIMKDILNKFMYHTLPTEQINTVYTQISKLVGKVVV